jgi:pyruvate,water dikinase
VDKLYWLNQIQQQDRAKVGDKALSLSRIMQLGYPVVPGFVISTEILQYFLETLNSSEALVADLPHSSLYLDVANWRQLQQVASRLRQEIITANVPSQWVNTILSSAREWQTGCLIFRPTFVLPSAMQEFENPSGLLESFFCCCQPEAVAQTLKRTWSQMFRARSLLYWQRAGIDLQQINLAVLVQPVYNARASGIFTANSGWEIQATWGLGMALTLGEVLPDVYYIHRETGAVLERQLGNKMLAYCLDIEAESSQQEPSTVIALEDNCLVAYLLKEPQQQQYALQEEYLQQIIQLANQLAPELGKSFTLKWTITEQTPNPKLYLTQVSMTESVIPDSHFLKGIGAAGGTIKASAHVIVNSQQKPEQLPKGVILVASAIAPDWLPILQQVGGIITEYGGLTSHAAIFARELGIPAVVSTQDATVLIQTGEQLLVDGDKGEIHRLNIRYLKDKKEEEHSLSPLSFPHPMPDLPTIATQLMVNLSQPSMIERVLSLPVDGIGLLRSELMGLSILEGQHPNAWLADGRYPQLLERWTEQIMLFARAFAPRPVFYRSLDWRSHELPSVGQNVPSSSQSMLGERGTFSYLANPAVFELELAALKAVQQANYRDIHLILPFVRTVEEFSFCRRKVEEAGLTQIRQFQLWIMAEVPSVLFLLAEYVKAGVQGISIGTNDLTQLILGIDRDQGHLARTFDERHPAVMGAISQLIQMANNAGIPCSICGQAPAIYPEIIENLIRWGITSISVEPEAVSRTYQAIARAEKRIILEAARRQI